MSGARLLEVRERGGLYDAKVIVELGGRTLVVTVSRLVRKPVGVRVDEEDGRKVIHFVDEKGEVFACTLALESG